MRSWLEVGRPGFSCRIGRNSFARVVCVHNRGSRSEPFETEDARRLSDERYNDLLAQELDRLKPLSDEQLMDSVRQQGWLLGGQQPQAAGGAWREGAMRALAEASLRERSRVVTFPLRKTPKSPRVFKSFYVVPIDVDTVGFVNFVLDSGTSGALIFPELREALGHSPVDGDVVKGVDSGGHTLRQKVALPPLRLGTQALALDHAFVSTIKSDLDVDVGGVLGLNFLRTFEIEVDVAREQLVFHPAGHIARGYLDVSGMACLTCDALKGGLLSLPVSINASERFPAILDLSANFSIINSYAAAAAGYSREGAYAADQVEVVKSTDGQRTQGIRRGFLDVVLGGEGDTRYVPVQMGLLVRDLPSMAALGYGEQPMMVLGRDLLGGRRLVLQLGELKVYVA